MVCVFTDHLLLHHEKYLFAVNVDDIYFQASPLRDWKQQDIIWWKVIAAISLVGPWIIAIKPRTKCRANCLMTECYNDIQRMYPMFEIWDVQKSPLLGNWCKIDSFIGSKYFIQLFHNMLCSCLTCKVPDMQTILHTLSEQLETPFIVIAGEMSFSGNLAESRPAWLEGSGISPARYAVDGNLENCATVPHDQPMVVDLGFNANTTLHVKITVKSAY